MGNEMKVRSGRLFFQITDSLTPYDPVQCTGLSDWNKPRGAITPIREQSTITIGEEEVVGYSRASPDMAAFTVQARFRELANFLLTLRCEINVQCCMVDCGDPTNYYGFQMGLAWVRCPPGDLTGEAVAIIEGDNVPINISNPFSAIYGPYLIDYQVGFLSARSIAETGAILDMVFFEEECIEDCLFRATKAQYGYAVSSAQAGSPVDAANVWYTEDEADTWSVTSENPFGAGEDISAVIKMGTVSNHRVVVARGETDAGNPAEIAYADCTVIGQTAWVTVNVGSVNGQYINDLAWPNFRNMFAITNDGYIYRSRDGGATWSTVYQHTSSVALNEISCLRDGRCWVVGDGDLALLSTDFGDAWSVVTGPVDNAGVNLNTVHVVPSRKVFIGASNGLVYASLDEASTAWREKAMQGITATNVVRIRAHDTHFIWAIADIAGGQSRVLRSPDGGASFRLWDLAQNINPNNGLYAMATMFDPNRVCVAGEPYPWAVDGGTAFLTKTDTNIDKIV